MEVFIEKVLLSFQVEWNWNKQAEKRDAEGSISLQVFISSVRSYTSYK